MSLWLGEEKNGEVFQKQNPSCWVSWGWWRGLYTCQSFKRFRRCSRCGSNSCLWDLKDSELQKAAAHPAEPSRNSRVKPVRSVSQAVSEGLRASAAEVNRLKRFYPKSFSLEKKKEGFQSQRHILSVLLPEKSVCRGVMLWSYPAYSEVPVLASLSCWAAWVSWNAASGWAVSGSSVHSLSSMSATPLSRSRKPKAKAAFRKRFSSWNKQNTSVPKMHSPHHKLPKCSVWHIFPLTPKLKWVFLYQNKYLYSDTHNKRVWRHAWEVVPLQVVSRQRTTGFWNWGYPHHSSWPLRPNMVRCFAYIISCTVLVTLGFLVAQW